MKRLVDFLAPLGILVVIGALAWQRAGKTLPGKMEYYVLAGAILVLAQIVLRFEEIVAAVGVRQAKYGANTLVVVLAVAGILGGINYLVVRHTKRWDLTKNQRYSLSDQTKKVVGALKDDVKITYFQRAANMSTGEDRLKEYQALSPRIKVEYVDPLAKPAQAQAYDAKGPWPILVVERASNRERITNDGEQDITNAIIKVTREAKKTVCFAEGEGERDIGDSGDRGYANAKNALERSQYETRKVTLLREKKVPEACSIFVVSGPEKDLLPPAIDAIRDYIKGGGKAMILVEPEFKDEAFPNLTGLLGEWNLETAKDVVVDVSGMGQLFGTGALTPLVIEYPYHEITKDFRVATAFHTARSLQAGTKTIDGVSAQNLVETSAASWAEKDLTLKDPVELNDGVDKKGPIALGAVATIRVGGPEPSPAPSPSPETSEATPPKPEGRVVALGDADFASDALLGFQGNKDFFLNAIAWLAQDQDLIAIRPKEPDDQRLFLTRDQQQLVWLLALFGFPGVFVVLGIAVWWRRR